jgi:branched-chain amino acid aminotransferase
MESNQNIFLLNGEICTNTICVPPGSLIVYDVIRIINQKPLFFSLHYYNLSKALYKSFKFKIEATNLKYQIKRLIELTKTSYGNIKLEFFSLNGKIQVLLHFIKHYYPKPHEYLNGVNLSIMKAERPNPQLKTWQNDIRSNANEHRAKTNTFEVLLLNDQNQITEGSRSNILFIKDKLIISPPSKLLLQGVTRKSVLKIIQQENDWQYDEKVVYYEDLKKFDAAFITGTSLNILPVSQINEIKFNSKNYIIQKLISNFNQLVEEDLNSFRFE